MQSFDLVKKAFSNQSEIFDKLDEQNMILKWMREIIYKHVKKYLRKNDSILELNAGTGIDSVYFAKLGHKIHCTDISEGMVEKLNNKIKSQKLNSLITSQLLSFTELNKLKGKSFDYIFSNFGGLNCTQDIKQVISQFRSLLNKNGRLTLVILPKICPWELLLLFKGNFKVAFRRLARKGVYANIDGYKFKTYYYSVSDIKKALMNEYKILKIQGLAAISPPPYLEKYSYKYPYIYKKLTFLDEKLSHIFPFNRWADHFIITAELK
ncbi:MAG: hypothetical protein COW08_06700 [Ignavibacteriales bacterium CG12_big_fil_rev_8_21_14_0_65_30_8]|nr:MAG: hypothetical protein COW08_06700 [Ignavibacteriales bacterium CG12_big_fil_rev_8_21_14_0_65_30_8]